MGAICGAGQGAGFVQKRTYSFLLPLQEGGLAVTIDSPCFYTLGLQEKKGLAQSHIAGGTWAGTDGSHPPLDPGDQAPPSAVLQWRDHLTS